MSVYKVDISLANNSDLLVLGDTYEEARENLDSNGGWYYGEQQYEWETTSEPYKTGDDDYLLDYRSLKFDMTEKFWDEGFCDEGDQDYDNFKFFGKCEESKSFAILVNADDEDTAKEIVSAILVGEFNEEYPQIATDLKEVVFCGWDQYQYWFDDEEDITENEQEETQE